MKFIKLGTRYYLAAPVLQLSADAEVAFVRSKAYSGGEETSGFVPAPVLALLVRGYTPAKGRRIAAELVQAGLWVAAEGGWTLPGWDEEQAELEAIVQRRAVDAERQRRHRATAAASRDASRDMSRDSPETSRDASVDSLSRARDRDRETEEEEEQTLSSDSADAEPDGGAQPEPIVRADVEQLCRLLVEQLVAHGYRKPNITKRWRQQARLLLDTDGVSLDLAEHVLRWAIQDSFWGPNIQSMPTFREKFPVLRARRKAEYERNRTAAAGTNGHAVQPTARDRALNPHLYATPIGGAPA